MTVLLLMKCSLIPFLKPRDMSQVTILMASASPLWAAKSSAKRSTVVASLPLLM